MKIKKLFIPGIVDLSLFREPTSTHGPEGYGMEEASIQRAFELCNPLSSVAF